MVIIDTNYELVASKCVKAVININDVKALHVRKDVKYVKEYYSSISILPHVALVDDSVHASLYKHRYTWYMVIVYMIIMCCSGA